MAARLFTTSLYSLHEYTCNDSADIKISMTIPNSRSITCYKFGILIIDANVV
jgi:hypothetical protein